MVQVQPEDMFAHRQIACTPEGVVDAVLETLTRWTDLAAKGGVRLETHAALVHIGDQATDVSIAARTYLTEDLCEDDDGPTLAVLRAPALPGDLLVIISRDGDDGGHTTTLQELQDGVRQQQQAAQAGLS